MFKLLFPIFSVKKSNKVMLKLLFKTKTMMLGCLTVLLFSTTTQAQMRGPMEEPFIPGHLIVQIAEGAQIERIISHLPHDFEFQLNRLLSDNMRAYLIEFNPEKIGQMEALKLINSQSGITIAQNNHLVEIRQVPNDTEFNQQWHHVNTGQTGGTVDADIDIDEAWDITTGGQNALGHDIVVCILEQVNFSHNDLINNHWTNPFEIPGNGIDDDGNGYIDDINGWNVGTNTGVLPTNQSGHGTSVAGMIGAQGNNSLGVAGANWDVKMMNVVGYNINSEASVVSAYNYPLTLRKRYNATNGAQGAFVVSTNASWGIDNANPNNYPIWCAFYDTLGIHGILNCGATTNSNLNVDVSGDMPTACPSQYMLGIGRSDHNDNFAGGYGLTTINFPAPGINVRTTANTNAYTTTTGTSFASPLTAGVVALLYSIPCPTFMNIVLNDPQGGADLVFNSLMDGVDLKANMTNFFVAGGRLNVKTSMDLLMDAVCSTCTPPSDIQVTATNDNDASISYTAVADADNYTIYIQVAGSGTWTSFTTTGTTYTFTGLTTCTEYEFYVETTCGAETSVSSAIQTFATTGCGSCIDLPYCATTTTNPDIFVGVHSPAGVETEYLTYILTNGWGAPLADGYAYGDLVLVDDGSAAGSEGCGALINGAAINGNIAVALRGTCDFSLKAFNAQNAGATGLIIINNQANAPASLGAGGSAAQVTIPVVMVSQADGAALLAHLNGGSSAVGFMGQQNEWIESFELNGVLSTSGDDGGYRAPGLTPINLDVNTPYTFTLTPGQDGQQMAQYTRIWVDLDQNGIFDASEIVYDQTAAAPGVVTDALTIPGTATLGSTRMRVQMAYQGYGAGALPAACGTFVSGEVEDYCIQLASGVVCGTVLNQVVTQPSCAQVLNGSITLNPTGGSAPYTYSWNNGAGNVSSVSGLGAGTIIATVTDSDGCVTSQSFSLAYTTSVVVSGVSTQPTCSPNTDGAITASATGGTGFTYQWTAGPAAATYSGLGAGTYMVTATADNGCSSSQSFTLNYTTNLAINGNAINPSCNDTQDGSITANATGGTGISYQWTGGPATATYSGIGEGTYEVTATAANGCSISESFTLTANPTVPTASFTFNQTSLTFQFLNTSTNGNGYAWDFGDGNSSASFNPTHTYAADGTYNVCLTVTGACENVTSCEQIIVSTVGLANLATVSGINVYPNPASDEINFEISLTDVKEIAIIDATGKLVRVVKIDKELTSVNVSQLTNGLYIYQVYNLNGDRIYVDKFSITK
jgi:PKD repeat protein